MKKILNKFSMFKKVSLIKYIYLNYFSTNVIRHGQGKIIPYKNSCIELNKNSEIHIYDGSIEIGKNKVKGSKTETYLRLRENAKWYVHESCDIAFSCTIEILKNALIDSKYFTMNINSTIISKKHISIGHNVMIGRNVIIYDSDFHSLYNNKGEIINEDSNVIINDNVWIGTNSIILKGIILENGVVVAANTIITNSVNEKELIVTKKENMILNSNIEWRR